MECGVVNEYPSLRGPAGQALSSFFAEKGWKLAHIVPVEKVGCADSPERYGVMDAKNELRAFVAVSSASFPDLVSSAASLADAAARAVGPKLSDTILRAYSVGYTGDRSFAVYPWCRAPGPIARRLARRSVLRFYLPNWLSSVTAKTARRAEAAEVEQSVASLARMATATALPSDLRREVDHTRRLYDLGSFQPMRVLAHGDLWLGNVLFGGRFLSSPVLIDWGGSSVNGYPIYDLIRLGDDLALSAVALRSRLEEHCRLLHCDIRHARAHATCALADLYGRLGEFEVERFAHLCQSVMARLTGAGATFA